MSRHAQRREARRLHRAAEVRAVDPTNPAEPENAELREAIQAAWLQAATRPRPRNRIEFSVWRWEPQWRGRG